jgi:hypothetical protein
MPTDDYGAEISAGDRLSLTVGIPGREVSVTVTEKRGRLVVKNDDGEMALSSALRYFSAEVKR